MDIKNIYETYKDNFVTSTANAFETVCKKIKDAWYKPIEGNYLIQASDGKQFMVLDIVGEEKLTMHSDVTDYYVENNTAYQDQIALNPKVFTVEGEIGELVYYENDPNESVIGLVSQKLQSVISFLPSTSKSFSKVKDKTMKLLSYVETADNLWTKITNLVPDANQQQKAYIFLNTIRDARVPVQVRTPWAILTDYVVTDIELTQPRTTADKTMIKVSFKEFKITHITPVEFDSKKYQGDSLYQNQPQVDQGTTAGEEVDTNGDGVSTSTKTDTTTGYCTKIMNITVDDNDNTYYFEVEPSYDGTYNVKTLTTDGVYSEISDTDLPASVAEKAWEKASEAQKQCLLGENE